MGTLVLIVIVAVFAGFVLWNHSVAGAAREGVRFECSAAPDRVTAAIGAQYCVGAVAKTKAMLRGVRVSAEGSRKFRTESRIGDVGSISVVSAPDGGSIVHAHTTTLYIGSHPMTHFKSPFYRTVAALTHGLYKMLGLAPNAWKMAAFQRGVEKRVTNQLRRAG